MYVIVILFFSCSFFLIIITLFLLLHFFFRQLEVASQAEDNQENLTLQRVIPLVERKLSNIEDQNRITYEKLAAMITELMKNVSDISTGRAPLQINIDWGNGAGAVPTTTIRTMDQALDSDPTTISGNVAVAQFPSQATHVPPATDTYRLSTSVFTVTDLYREWTVGLGGGHSVEYMNSHHPGWYSSQKSFYMRRRRIIKACEEYAAAEGITIEDTVRKAEAWRVMMNKSLDYLSKNSDKMLTSS